MARPYMNPPDRAEGPPAQQVVHTGVLRGFDYDSCIATFGIVRDGIVSGEISVALHKGEALFGDLIRKLAAGMEKQGQPVVWHLRVALRSDREIPDLLYAEPCAPEKDVRFTWAGTQLRWTRELDGRVDTDFDWRSRQFAADYLHELADGATAAAVFPGIVAEARQIFAEQAKSAGLPDSPDDINRQFHPRGSFREIMTGSEHRQCVRYDTRYAFSQQNAHVRDDPAAMAAALVNYAFQAAVVERGARRAAAEMYLGEGRSGSLAQAHQAELVKEKVLLAPNPGLESNAGIFAAYSYEETRLAVAGLFAGAMDAARIPAARPELDEIEVDKQHGDPAKSPHQQTLLALPPEADNPEDPLVRAGAYLQTAHNLTNGYRRLSQQAVAVAQQQAAPDRKETPRDPKRASQVAETFHHGVKYLEGICDGM
ncbi:MAG: hypothetical protein PHE83_18485 [Opitutaceae bacterium]|nr:hypothetical protein [Opitutaceae bacterium]